MKEEMPVVRTKSEMARSDGKHAVLLGRYRARPRPVKGKVTQSAPEEVGVIELSDGSEVYLEALDSPRSKRPSEELRRFNGQRVRVKGVLHKQMPSIGQSLIAPCISDIEGVELEQGK
jgi:hypothetical protein